MGAASAPVPALSEVHFRFDHRILCQQNYFMRLLSRQQSLLLAGDAAIGIQKQIRDRETEGETNCR